MLSYVCACVCACIFLLLVFLFCSCVLFMLPVFRSTFYLFVLIFSFFYPSLRLSHTVVGKHLNCSFYLSKQQQLHVRFCEHQSGWDTDLTRLFALIFTSYWPGIEWISSVPCAVSALSVPYHLDSSSSTFCCLLRTRHALAILITIIAIMTRNWGQSNL